MSESQIVQALKKFKADYAWDKSLNSTGYRTVSPSLPDSRGAAQIYQEFTEAMKASAPKQEELVK